MAEATEDMIIALLCQQRNTPLLIPNISVAEIVDIRTIDYQKNCEEQFGIADWRNQRICIVSIDGLLDGRKDLVSDQAKIVVMHTLSSQAKTKFYGIIIDETPRMIKVTVDDLQPVDEDRPAYIQSFSLLDGQKVAIPNLQFIESVLPLPESASQ